MHAKKDLSISQLGSSKIKNGMTIFVYCYSKTVIEVLLEAKSQGKNFSVMVPETRPNFTGRMTAEALSKVGINVTQMTDMTGLVSIPKADIIFIGADIVTKNGSIVNKIGTSMIATIAKRHHVKVYCCTRSSKFAMIHYDPSQTVRTRPLEEVIKKPLKNIMVINPAYDVTEAKNITGIISEFGITSPKIFVKACRQLRTYQEPLGT